MTAACVLTFATTSHVYQAERLLRTAGLPVGLRPVPQGVSSRCGVCLQGELARVARYREILTGAHAPAAVYESTPDGGGWKLYSQAING